MLIFLLEPTSTSGAAVTCSFDETTLSKPNIGPDLVISFDEAPEAVNSVNETTLSPKLNEGGLAIDPFGEAGLTKSTLVCVAAVVVEFDASTFSPTLDSSAVPT